MALDAAAISLVQAGVLDHLIRGFAAITQYALNLLYIFVGFEVVVFGLLWALQQESGWGRLLLKVIKIGLIFFIIQHFGGVIGSVVASFADVGSKLAPVPHLTDTFYNPALLWKYGYNSSVALLKAGSAVNVSVGLAMVQISLGLGILLCFALLGIQIVLQLVGFYFTSLLGLLLIPLGVFSPATQMLEQVIQSILKAGVRVLVLFIVVGAAITTWHLFGLDKQAINVTVNEALGLFDSALLFAYLAIRLPGLVANVVGRLQLDRLVAQAGAVVYPASSVNTVSPSSPSVISSMQAAVALPSSSEVTVATQIASQQAAPGAAVSASSAPSVSVNAAVPTSAMRGLQRGKSATSEAYRVNKSVSDDLLNKLSGALKKNQGGLDDRFKDDGR